MGKKSSRNTVKTGDKALNKKRQQAEKEASRRRRKDSDDDPTYSKVDKFYNQRDEQDYLDLTGGGDDQDSEDDEILKQEAVFELGGGDVSEDENDSEVEEEEDPKETAAGAAEDDDIDASSSSDEEEEETGNVRNWGARKSVYYHGDTADLEIGQEQEDAFVEEEAAKEVQMARLKELSEEDFILSDHEGEEKEEKQKGEDEKKPSTTGESITVQGCASSGRDTSKWTPQQQQTFLQKNHPEFFPLVNHFTDVVKDFDQRTNVVVNALYEGEDEDAAKTVGATPTGERYLLSRALLQSSAALNLATYLLLKSDYASVETPASIMDDTDDIMCSHPILDHLQKLDNLAEKMEQLVKDTPLNDHLNTLVKASALIATGQVEEEEKGENSSKREESDGEPSSNSENEEQKPAAKEAHESPSSSSSEEEEEDEVALKAQQEAALMNEARFALRLNEVGVEKKDSSSSGNKKRRRRGVAPDFGEDSDAQEAPHRSLATTVNALEQRFAARKNKATKTAAAAGQADQLDEFSDDDEDNEVRRGLELMEAELGKASNEEDDDEKVDDSDMDVEQDEDADDFYKQVEKKKLLKKQERKEKYAVAPKFPKVDHEVEGERAASRTIIKNRGLVPHKNKLNRNPRVKKREQYRKALIRRKGAVRAMRDSKEGQMYGGEETGIKSNIRRSRNLT